MLAAMLLLACEAPIQADSNYQSDEIRQSGEEMTPELETTESNTMKPTETEPVMETSGEDVTETKTDIQEQTTATEAVTKESNQAETKELTQAPSEKDTEREVPTPTEKVTQKATEKATPAPTAAPTQPPTEPPTQPPTEPAISAEMAARVQDSMTVYADYIQAVIDQVNARRSASGLQPLQRDETLCQVATYRCIEIIDTDMFSHTRPDGTPCYTLFDAYGVVYNAAGENLAAGQRSPEEVVTDWINSPGHRANILGDYMNIGVGVAVDSSGCLYWAQSFTKVKK